MTEPAAVYEDLREEIQTVLVGNESVLETLTISLLTGGHVLVEGVPGVAKTTIARLFAAATGLDANRVQMTPDVLPADITGTHIYRETTGEFELQRGPVFANVVVVDEINRATPKTQSALLEAMQENAVTIDGDTLRLPDPFFVVATQNPIEMEGTYELPVAQRDRFQFKFTVGMPDEDEELALLDRFDDRPELGPEDVSQVVTAGQILDAREVVAAVHVDPAVKRYLRDLVNATRETPDLEYGASPRAALFLLDATKARAALRGREYATPDDVKALARPALAHRLVTSAEAELSDVSVHDVLDEVLTSVDPPDGDGSMAGAENAAASGREDS
ncbi:MoxR family ATPase (plasmid) [Halorussus salilacus]|uniref:AAA family ATPase n=1 Tax=Halorussus salilacus TaxID=2953750 RepID=UPI00209D1976|nr:MoxR family ATPase [Halorussus salilacus]USZ69998.1 MoxR family ATPase [Halorussus salilacus]